MGRTRSDKVPVFFARQGRLAYCQAGTPGLLPGRDAWPTARQRRLAYCQAGTPGLLPGRDAWPTARQGRLAYCQAETPGPLPGRDAWPTARQGRLAYCQAETPGLLPGRDAWPTARQGRLAYCQAETPGLLPGRDAWPTARQRRLAYWWDRPWKTGGTGLCACRLSGFLRRQSNVGNHRPDSNSERITPRPNRKRATRTIGIRKTHRIHDGIVDFDMFPRGIALDTRNPREIPNPRQSAPERSGAE